MTHEEQRLRREEIIKAVAQGQPPEEVAAQYGLNASYIREFCLEAGVFVPKPRGRPISTSPPRLLLATIAKYDGLDWTKQDVILCKVAGVSRERIRQLRIALGKPQSPNYHKMTKDDWREGELAKLGKFPDWQVAEMTGRSPHVIWRKRTKLGIPAIHRDRRTHIWTTEELAMLGQMTDAKLAKIVGVHEHSIMRKRNKLGIAPWRWAFNAGVANPKAFKRRSWTPREQAILGTMSDGGLAEKIGCSPAGVYGERRRQGIPPFKPNHKTLARLKKELADAEGHEVLEPRGQEQDQSIL